MDDAVELMKEFTQEYQQNPKGWSFWISEPSESGDFYDTYIFHKSKNEAYFLKTDSIYTPNPLGKGAKIKLEEDQVEDNLPDFGFRKFSQEEVRRFLENLPNPGEYQSEEEFEREVKKRAKNFEKGVMRKNPVPFGPPKHSGEVAAVGPFGRGNPLSHVSKKQEELDRKLSEELEKMERREYPGYY